MTSDVEGIDAGLTSQVVDDGTVIILPKCSLQIQGADTDDPAGITLDTSRHQPYIQRLTDIDPRFNADDTANTVVTSRIRRGTLVAYRNPGSPEFDPAIVSRLEVPYDGAVTIGVNSIESGQLLTIRLKPGAEVVLANAAPRVNPAVNTRNHFLLYERLANGPVNLSHRPPVPMSRLALLPTANPFFAAAGPIGTSGDCGNTGCCP